ncbi:hypothetical protein M9458_003454, partial [Cirrhinus mrigala]
MLANLRQGDHSVSDYSIEFHTLAAECKWNEEAQWDMFLHGLADRIQKEIFMLELPTNLDALIALTIHVDTCLQQQEQRVLQRVAPVSTDLLAPFSSDVVSLAHNPEPMQ